MATISKKEYKEIFWALAEKQINYFREKLQIENCGFADKEMKDEAIKNLNQERKETFELMIKIAKLGKIDGVENILKEGVCEADFILKTAELKKQ